MTCRPDSTAPVVTAAALTPAPSAATARRMRASTSVSATSSGPQRTVAVTTSTGNGSGLRSSPVTPGVPAVVKLPKPTISSPSPTPDAAAGPGRRSTQTPTSVPSASRVIAAVRRWISRAGALLAPRRTHLGGGQTLLPPGRQWRRHHGQHERLRRLIHHERQQTRISCADLDRLERRYRERHGG
jgi:hypothetical protein